MNAIPKVQYPDKTDVAIAEAKVRLSKLIKEMEINIIQAYLLGQQDGLEKAQKIYAQK